MCGAGRAKQIARGFGARRTLLPYSVSNLQSEGRKHTNYIHIRSSSGGGTRRAGEAAAGCLLPSNSPGSSGRARGHRRG